MTELSNKEKTRYSRHLLLPEVGEAGQLKLKDASVLVIGAGGLGSPVSLYLAAAGVGRLGIVDFDDVDLTNLQRQVLYTVDDVGQHKAEKAREKLSSINPEIKVESHHIRLNAANVLDILRPYDIIVDGTDNFTTRYLINDACVILKKPNVYGAIFRFEGQVSIFCAPNGPCYRCMFPTPPPPEAVPNCAEGGVLGVLAGAIGTLQATEAIKLILGTGESLIGKILLYNALDMTFQKLNVKKKSTCPVCGDHPTITAPTDEIVLCQTDEMKSTTTQTNEGSPMQAIKDIQPKELADRLKSDSRPILLDVRNNDEVAICKIEGAIHIPLPELQARVNELNKDDEMVVYCKSGVRSQRAIFFLQQVGFNKLTNLHGGIMAWANEVDKSLCLY